MSLPGASTILYRSALSVRVAKAVGGSLLGLTLLGWIVDRHGASNGEVVVHVMEPDVDVTIGGTAFHLGSLAESPAIFELAPGEYELVMSRPGRVLYREVVQVERGEARVSTAWRTANAGTDYTSQGP